MQGIGYQQYKQMRMEEEGLSATELELPGNERFLIYFGRGHLEDHETNVVARGPMKIGRGKYATAIMRGRNQFGADFRVYNEILFDCNKATNSVEDLISTSLARRRLQDTIQGQDELYDFRDSELPGLLQFVTTLVEEHSPYYILECNSFVDDRKISLPFIRNEAKQPGFKPVSLDFEAFNAMFSREDA